ncbi:DNA-processing protein DprA [Polymorphospora sp. NPDC050346]|uniref:DNA-processing protein DprA n=1 Tax=Polymorphospora sp. NPDC050346 TaxID=3155780 RepID=UPI0033FC3A48
MGGIDRTRLARVAVNWLAEPGNWAAYRMVATDGPVRALQRMVDGDVPDPGLRTAVGARLASGDPWAVAEAAAERAGRLGARIVVPGDDEWPGPVGDLTRLALDAERRVDRETAPPLCLWVRGHLDLAGALDRAVAVVGARAASPYGLHVAGELGFGLAERGWTVVSGGAFGIDAAAHRAALNADGTTVAVLACGLDRPYPAGNTALFDRIADTGLLVSEWLPGQEPLRHRFLIRNRVIAAGTAGTVLVEAAARSGATQTMRRALGIGRRAMVVPGPVTSAMSVGCHELLRDHPDARLVTGVPHVLEEVGRIGADLAPPVRAPEQPRDRLDDQAAQLLEAMPRRGPIGLDPLAARAGVDVRTAMRKVALLEQLGFVVRHDDGYALTPKSRGSGPPGDRPARPAPADRPE